MLTYQSSFLWFDPTLTQVYDLQMFNVQKKKIRKTSNNIQNTTQKTNKKEKLIIQFDVNTAIGLADSPGATLVIFDNMGWYCDIFIHQRQFQIVP